MGLPPTLPGFGLPVFPEFGLPPFPEPDGLTAFPEPGLPPFPEPGLPAFPNPGLFEVGRPAELLLPGLSKVEMEEPNNEEVVEIEPVPAAATQPLGPHEVETAGGWA